MIYQLYKKQAEAWKEGLAKFKFWLYELDEQEILESRETIVEAVDMLSSRHKDTIELIEKTKDLLQGLKGRRHPNDLFFQDCPNCGELANEAFVADKFVQVWDDALDEGVKELEAQIKLIKKEL